MIGQSPASGAGAFVLLLAGALIVGVIARRFRLPYTVALVVAGVAVSFDRDIAPFDFGAGLLYFFLPPLLFEAAWNLHVDALKRTWRSIATLALPGVFITMGIVAAIAALSGVMTWQSALVLGAIVSATDPVAVIATFARLRVPVDLAAIVEGESLANDGVAAVLAAALIAVAGGAGLSIPGLALETVVSSLGGIVIGILGAFIVAQLLRGNDDPEMWTVGTVLAAYGPYLAAGALHESGIFAAVSAGIALRAFFGGRVETGATVEAFWGAFAFVTNSLVFLLMGLTMRVDRLIGEPALVGMAIAAACVSRLVVAFGLPRYPELRAGGVAWRWIISLAGMRGGLGIALALSLPAAFPQRLAVIDGVFAVVLFTVVVQGLAIGPVVARLPSPTGEA